MIRPRITVRTSTTHQFVDAAKRESRAAVRRELEAIGREWEEEVVKIVQAELPRRDGVRHKTNTTHLEESFQYRIQEGGRDGFPRLELTTKPGVSGAKIGALNSGVPGEHEIPRSGKTIPLRWGEAPGDLSRGAAFSGQVTWKPTGKIQQGWQFMERARDRVLARRRRSG